MKDLEKELAELRNSIKQLQNGVEQTFEERKLEMSYEREKMRFEAGFNARNIILVCLLILALCSQILFGMFIYKYFEFEAQNTERYIEVQNVSENHSMLYNSVASKDK